MDLIINKTYIDNNKLVSKIEYENKSYDMYFKVEDEYKKYLCDMNANSFLIALLPFIVKHNYNVIIKDKISSKLYYQLTTYLLPLLCKAFKKNNINIECELTDELYNGKAIGASISCGVDSFYTLFKHRNLKNNKNITHLCFFNAGSNGDFGGEDSDNLYKKRLSHVREFCKKYNYPFITIDSNMNELILMSHEKRHTFTTLACVYALEKLFNTYYFASGLEFDGSHIDEKDTAFYDILNVHALSNENIAFYCSGLETSRIEKVKFISEFEETYDYLNVCVGHDWDNCSRCEKCSRTMAELESIGKLDKYKNVFDLDYYYKNRNKILSTIIHDKRDPIKKYFCIDTLKTYKENNIKIPFSSYIIAKVPTWKKVKIHLRKYKIVKKIRKIEQPKDGWMD